MDDTTMKPTHAHAERQPLPDGVALDPSLADAQEAPRLPRETLLPADGEDADALGLQISISPFFGMPDFSGLAASGCRRKLDPVSVADLLRNSFVYPPNSIFEDVKLVTFDFDPRWDMRRAPQFRYNFRESQRSSDCDGPDAEDWVGSYHSLLCDAVASSCQGMQAPWLLQSGGKDSTSIAIAAADSRPDLTCLTYLGGNEEDEVGSARSVARTLGLRHEALVCDPGRAYDRYLKVIDRMPLLTADFALLSYVDLVTEICDNGGDGVVDGLGSDGYFGMPLHRDQWLLSAAARRLRLPRRLFEMPMVENSFKLSYLLASLQMSPVERVFPGSRFSDAEVNELFGRDIADASRQRLKPYEDELSNATSAGEWRMMSLSIMGSAAGFAKGLYTTCAMSIRGAYPYCDRRLREWVFRKVPSEQLMDPVSHDNKVLVRKHIETRFRELPYVQRKGSFRFDVCGLAEQRFDVVYEYARRNRHVLPGAVAWLEHNRDRLHNKYHASKFYLLAVVLPWIEHRSEVE